MDILERPDEFPDEAAQGDMLGLLYLGSLKRECQLGMYSFTLRTLKTGEELAVGQITKEFVENPAYYGKAVATATVGAAVELMNGRPFGIDLGPDMNNNLMARYHFVRDNWYWPTIEFLYNEYDILYERMLQAFDRLQGNS